MRITKGETSKVVRNSTSSLIQPCSHSLSLRIRSLFRRTSPLASIEVKGSLFLLVQQFRTKRKTPVIEVHNSCDGGCKIEGTENLLLTDPKTALCSRKPCKEDKGSIPPLPGEGSMPSPRSGTSHRQSNVQGARLFYLDCNTFFTASPTLPLKETALILLLFMT